MSISNSIFNVLKYKKYALSDLDPTSRLNAGMCDLNFHSVFSKILIFLLKVPYKFSSSSEGETSSKPQSYSLPCIENSDQVIKMVPLLDLKKSEQPCFDENYVEQELTPFDQSYKSTEYIGFPQIPELDTDFTFPMERVDEHNLFDVFGPLETSEFGMVPFFEPSGSCKIDRFFDDFPEDMFDNIEPPSNLSKL